MARRVVTKRIPGPCTCCTLPVCRACPTGTVLPSSFHVALSGVSAGAYGWGVLNSTWFVTWDFIISKWIFQTTNPPFLVGYDYAFNGSSFPIGTELVYAYPYAGPFDDKGDLVTVQCALSGATYHLLVGINVFDMDAVGTPPFGPNYWRSARWIYFDFAISPPSDTCNPLFIEKTITTTSGYRNGWGGFGPNITSLQTPTLTIYP